MALDIVSDIVSLSLAITGAMAFISTVVLLFVAVARGRRVSVEGDEIYIGGESEDVLRHKVPSVIALYWGIVKRAWRKAFEILRNAVHTGVLNDWYGFMSAWLSVLLFVVLVVLVVYVVG